METITCDRCPWCYNEACLHPKARLGQHPFPACQGKLWEVKKHDSRG
jgi:hypothetical protein